MTTKAASHFHQQSCGPDGGWGAEVPGHFGVEKKVIMDAIGPSLRNPASAKYRWAKFPAVVAEIRSITARPWMLKALMRPSRTRITVGCR